MKISSFFWDQRYKTETDLEVSRRIILLNYLFLVISCFLIPFGFFSFIQGDYTLGILDLSVAVILFLARFYYTKTSNYHFLSNAIIILLGSFYLYLLSYGGNSLSGPLWSFTFPVTVLFLLGRIKGRTTVLIYFIIVILIFIVEPVPNVFSFSYKIRFLGAFLGTSAITYFVEYVRENMQGLLRNKNLEIQNSLEKLNKSEIELLAREHHYRSLFERSSDAIFLMEGNIFIECNPKTLEIFGCEMSDIIGKTPYRFSPKYQADGIPSEEHAMVKINSALNGEHQFFEWTHCRLDGTEFLAEVNLDLIESFDKKLIQASVRDITERKRTEEAMFSARESAEKSDRLKSDFLAQMSHEIRTPINTIMNYTSLLKMEFEDVVSEENAGSFNSIQNAAVRLLRTIELILNVSDLEAGTYEPKFESTSLADNIVTPVVNEFKQAAENKNLKLKYIVQCEDSSTIVDVYTVYQTVANLVDNAIKYTQRGEIIVSLTKFDKIFKISIKDTGIGISQKYIPNLFDKFSQEEKGYTRKFEGSGLGLALVKRYCEINGIEISVSSEKGIGTEFSLTIPIIKEKLLPYIK